MIIPLPGRTAPLPNAAAPTLDRERRPTVDTRGQQQAIGQLANAQRQPEVPMSLGDNPGLQAIGRAVGEVGTVLGALALKQREAQTDVQIGEIDAELMNAQSLVEQDKLEADPAEWGSIANKRLAEVREKIGANTKLTPQAREAAGLRMTRFEGQLQANVGMDAAKEMFSRAKSTFVGYAHQGIETQSEQMFEETMRTGADKGYFYPHEVQSLRERFKTEGERQAKQAEADTKRIKYEAHAGEAVVDPIAWQERNKEPWKDDPLLWRTIKNISDEAKREKTSEAIDELQETIVADNQSITVPEEIDAWDSKFLTPEHKRLAKDLLAKRHDAEAAADREQNGVRNAVELRKRFAEIDPDDDPTQEGYFTMLAEINQRVPESQGRGELRAMLKAKYGKKAEPVRPEKEQYIRKTLDTIFDPYQGAIKWKSKVAGKDAAGRKKELTVEDPVKKQQAIDMETEAAMQLSDYLQQNPDATLNDLKKRAQEVMPNAAQGAFFRNMKPASKPADPGTLPDDLISAVKGFESFIPKAYGDYKQTSVGYGTRAKSRGEVLTEAQADARLREELAMHAGRVDSAASKAGVALTNGQRNALISFDFNTGRGAHLLETSSGNLAEVRRRLLLYTKAGGKDLAGLQKRRRDEANIFDS